MYCGYATPIRENLERKKHTRYRLRCIKNVVYIHSRTSNKRLCVFIVSYGKGGGKKETDHKISLERKNETE